MRSGEQIEVKHLPHTVREEKQALRRRILDERAQLSEAVRMDESRLISGHLLKTVRAVGCRSIAGFLPTAEEVQLGGFYQAIGADVEIWLPRTTRHPDGAPALEWALLPAADGWPPATWRPGHFGIIEPPAELCRTKIRPDFIILPCVAVNLYGERLGYGGGYYDRWLDSLSAAAVPHAVVAFSCQILADRLPQEPHDRKVERIIGPTGAYEIV